MPNLDSLVCVVVAIIFVLILIALASRQSAKQTKRTQDLIDRNNELMRQLHAIRSQEPSKEDD